VDPPAEQSFEFDFFLRLFLGMSGRLCEGDTLPRLELGTMGSLLSLLSSAESLELLDGRLDCLGLSVFSLLGDPVTALLDEWRLDDLGTSGKSLAGEFGVRVLRRFESRFQSKCITNVIHL
jgi:hypothetical protein